MLLEKLLLYNDPAGPYARALLLGEGSVPSFTTPCLWGAEGQGSGQASRRVLLLTYLELNRNRKVTYSLRKRRPKIATSFPGEQMLISRIFLDHGIETAWMLGAGCLCAHHCNHSLLYNPGEVTQPRVPSSMFKKQMVDSM